MIHYELNIINDTGVFGYRFLREGQEYGACVSPVVPDPPVIIRTGQIELESRFEATEPIEPGTARAVASKSGSEAAKLTYIGDYQYLLFCEDLKLIVLSAEDGYEFLNASEKLAYLKREEGIRDGGGEGVGFSAEVSEKLDGLQTALILSFPMLRFVFKEDDHFKFSYEGTDFTIHKDHAGQYIFRASISRDARKLAETGESFVCSKETLVKAVSLAKEMHFERLEDQIQFDPFWQEWRIGLEYPYFDLSYSLGGETYSLRNRDETLKDHYANITVFSPAFPRVMTLLHELAVLFRNTQREAFPIMNAAQDGETTRYKVLCPFCGRAIRPNSNYCSACGKPLVGIRRFTPSEEEVDLDETIHLCKYCRNDVSWNDDFCRSCGKRL